MPNQEQFLLLKKGVSKWNAWRDSNPSIKVDLCNTDLRWAELSGVNFRSANLSSANLSGANLSNANLDAANLSEANVYEATFSEASLEQANLYKANLKKAILDGANTCEADFSDAILIGATFNGADLSFATFLRADLRRASFEKTDLIEANFNDAKLGDANLSDANLSGAKLISADLRRANLSGANLSEANLSSADLRWVKLNAARLFLAVFDGATLTRSCLWETQRSGWSIKGVICEAVYWDEKAKNVARYGLGDFERFFSEKTKILLHYKNGIDPLEIATLPALIQNLETVHPGCKLRFKSIEDTSGGAIVTVVIDNSEEISSAHVEKLQADATQKQLFLRKALEEKRNEVLGLKGEIRALERTLNNLLLTKGTSQMSNNTFNFNAPVHSNVIGDVQGDAIYNAGKTEDLQNLLAAISQKLASSPDELPTEQKAELEKKVTELQTELAKPEPDKVIINGGLQFVRDVLVKAASGAAGGAIVTHWHEILDVLRQIAP